MSSLKQFICAIVADNKWEEIINECIHKTVYKYSPWEMSYTFQFVVEK